MTHPPLPPSLRKAMARLEAEPERAWRLGELAAVCGVAPRTLQKQFQRFLGRNPCTVLYDLRYARARQALLGGAARTSVTEVATRCGFAHLGRFATAYHRRYGETPSTTLRRAARIDAAPALPLVVGAALERPTIAVVPFAAIGPLPRAAAGLAEEIGVALWRLQWLKVTAPAHARYHLRGAVREDAGGALRVTVRLLDAATGRYLWAATWDGDRRDPLGFEERTARGAVRAIQTAVRAAEVARAASRDRAELTAWELTMRALPSVVSTDAAAESMALELLYQAMELAPRDPLPMAVAAWCHGLRAGHHFTARPEVEKAAGRELAARAARLNAGDPLAETMLASGYTLAHDLAAAAVHADRALALDGGAAWAWGRRAWIKAYSGDSDGAIEEFRIARSLAPADPLNFLWSVGIGSAEFQRGRYAEAITWYTRAAAENPACTWNNRFLTPAYVLAGRRDEARHTVAQFTRAFPDVGIAAVRASLPWNAGYLDRISAGLEAVGMRA
jgi:AraC-like DNA-binding protein/tetratricopeptide (TPR) repeat protein